MNWDNVGLTQLGVLGIVLLLSVGGIFMFAFLLRVRRRLTRLREQLDANDAKLRMLFTQTQHVDSSNGKALPKDK